MWKNLPLFPEQASSMASQVDGLYLFLVSVSVFFTLLIFALVFVFAPQFRMGSKGQDGPGDCERRANVISAPVLPERHVEAPG